MVQDYIALDLETTGLNPSRDRILEIGAVRVKNGCVEETYSTLVDCNMNIPAHITSLTGISNEMLEDARQRGTAAGVEEAVKKLADFCGELPLLGHNIRFDYSFVKQTAVNIGIGFEKDGIDTLRIAREFLPELPSRSLEALCGYYKIAAEEHHRAAADAVSAAKLYHKLAEEFENAEAKAFFPQKLLYRAKKQSPATKFHEMSRVNAKKIKKYFMRPQKGRLFAPEIPAPTSKSRGSSGDSY